MLAYSKLHSFFRLNQNNNICINYYNIIKETNISSDLFYFKPSTNGLL